MASLKMTAGFYSSKARAITESILLEFPFEQSVIKAIKLSIFREFSMSLKISSEIT